MMERADSAQKLYTRMRLWEFPDQYVIEPTDGSCGSSLAISRVDGSMKLTDELPECGSVRVPKIRTIFGVVGMLKLVAGSYLVVITERECVGSYLGHSIFKISSLKVFPCDHSLSNTPVEQKNMEAELSKLLNIVERTHGLYFSYDTNLTLSAQRLHYLGDESKLLPLWRQAEPRFLWNSYMLEMLVDIKLDPYMLPVIQGSFQNFQSAIGKDIVDVTLISRRCTRRHGTRMWRRGADSDGYAANFVETEQIMHFNGFTGSFVQIRGSIPLQWEQIVDLTYKPKFEIIKLEEAPQVVDRHFLDLRKKYGNVLAVDLVNKLGGEGRLCQKFANAMQHVMSDDVRYLHFDFHQICGHVHFERLSILYEQISDFVDHNGYLLLNEKGEKMKEQLGVIRTNCIDCLDRTNVTQSMIGRKMLECQLRRLGVFGADETISSHPNLDECFKILWANHGDDISIQYSGTPALKGDFVRYGQRTVQGILKDGWNALARYYLNNFSDGTKQDAIDLVHGHYIASISRDFSYPSKKGGGLEAVATPSCLCVAKFLGFFENAIGINLLITYMNQSMYRPLSFPLALSLMLTGFFFATMSLRQARHDFRHLFFSVIWASLSLVIAWFVRTNGRIFCNRPHLFKPQS